MMNSTSTLTTSTSISQKDIIKEFVVDDWLWDKTSKPPQVKLSSNQKDAYFHIDPIIQTTSTVAVRGNKGFSFGEHYWEIVFLEPPIGASVMVGVGTARAALQSDLSQCVDLIGQNQESWGLSYKGTVWHAGVRKKFCEPFYEANTTIGLLLNMNEGTLAFFKNGESIGQAFTGLTTKPHEPLFPLISSSASETELGLGARLCRYFSLQEKCFSRIKKSLNTIENVDSLPLPNVMKVHIRSL